MRDYSSGWMVTRYSLPSSNHPLKPGDTVLMERFPTEPGRTLVW